MRWRNNRGLEFRWATHLWNRCCGLARSADAAPKALELGEYGFVVAERAARCIECSGEAFVTGLLCQPKCFVKFVELALSGIVRRAFIALVDGVLRNSGGIDAAEAPVFGFGQLGKGCQIVIERFGWVIGASEVFENGGSHYLYLLVVVSILGSSWGAELPTANKRPFASCLRAQSVAPSKPLRKIDIPVDFSQLHAHAIGKPQV